MRLSEESIFRIADNVWTMILALELQRGPLPDPSRAAERTVSASVQISGAWEGVVHLQCAATLAAQAAATMFGIGPAEVRADQIQDALGELANMVGGNIKALLPEPSRLSLPTVVDGVGYTVRVPGRVREVVRVPLACRGDPLVVVVLTNAEEPRTSFLRRPLP
jgi:chemotaxis protein CheX